MRFVTGQYSQLVRHGGMIAFVLDGDIASAVQGIGRNITKRHTALRMVGQTLASSRYRIDDDEIHESEHQRSVDTGNVLIQHFFVPAKQVGET